MERNHRKDIRNAAQFFTKEFLTQLFFKFIWRYGRKVITLPADTETTRTQPKRTPRNVSARKETTETKSVLYARVDVRCNCEQVLKSERGPLKQRKRTPRVNYSNDLARPLRRVFYRTKNNGLEVYFLSQWRRWRGVFAPANSERKENDSQI